MEVDLFDEDKFDDVVFFNDVDRTVPPREANGPLSSALTLEWFVVVARNLTNFFKRVLHDGFDPGLELGAYVLGDSI